MKVWLNGQLVEKDEAKISVFDHGVLYGDGVFEGIRVYGGKIFQGAAHLDRLFESARQIRLAIPQTKDELTLGMQQCVRANGLSEGYIRLGVTRGEGTLGLHPFHCPSPNTFIIADQLGMYTEEMYAHGMAVIIVKSVRRTSATMLDPKIKSLNYLNNILAKIECIDAGVLEGLMRNEKGNICEATGDNVFIVKAGRLITPPAEAGILLGITRGVVMHLAKREGVGVEETDIQPDDVYAADECFLTGTGAQVIAVTKVDHTPIGSGAVGPVTQKLFSAFRAFVQTDEPLPYAG